MTAQHCFALTPGEPAGIGPDLCLLLARQAQPAPLVAIASRELLAERAKQLGLNIELLTVGPQQWPDSPAAAGSLYVWDTPLTTPAIPGKLMPANAAYVLQTLTRAGQGCLDGTFAGMITAPVHKGVINEAGIAFSGHTEFLAELTHTQQVVMMLATRGLRVALVTTHLPLKDVAAAITAERLERVTRILHADLQCNVRRLPRRVIVTPMRNSTCAMLRSSSPQRSISRRLSGNSRMVSDASSGIAGFGAVIANWPPGNGTRTGYFHLSVPQIRGVVQAI